MPAPVSLRLPLTALCLLVLSSALCVTEVLGWGCVGHMLLAEIARRQLDIANEEKIQKMAAVFSDNGPFPMSPSMVQAACWADDVKFWRQYAMSTWHFYAVPYNPENMNITDPVNKVNAVTVCLDMVTSLKNSKAPLYLLNFAWVNLVHIFGDLHQPLHTISRYSATYPHGDQGGNAVTVRVGRKTLKLHALWDNICTATPPRYQRPLSYTDLFALSVTADRLLETYTFSEKLQRLVDVMAIHEESYMFAVNSSYPGVTPGGTLSRAYLDQCKRVAEARLTLGGYRLGYLLNQLLSGINVDEAALEAHRAARPKWSA
ncbi:p1/s1 nuclease [Leishmania mexicana MHOM/GT/2001/U1103]|uniref:P1/s1 nuclease n=1 Tax=Leishmania mexicana (strain MHOM/GT/2001/U1103) TaxID=929439 RepID=E9B0S5_LEIMU|nr:p1/s1 nuclease [Leishmania mexicana MHOM/GT/2001/U1103]CBZ28830.1 p1/s1 nuclease [Leishmania mexicana MHOM/GT/2001/U1103]